MSANFSKSIISVALVGVVVAGCKMQKIQLSAAVSGSELTAVSAPSFNPADGTYNIAQSVTLASTTPGAAIYYTVDGTKPSASSTLYSGAINVSSTTTISAIAVSAGSTDSTINTAAYTINVLTPTVVEAFPDTSAFPTVTWTPRVKFSLAADDNVGLFSDTAGTAISTPASVSAGSNTLLGNAVSTLGLTNTVYAKSSAATQYVNVGSYTTKLPPNFSVPGLSGPANVIVKDSVSPGCTASPNCLIVGGGFTGAGGIGANNIVKIKPDGNFSVLGTGTNAGVDALAVDSAGNLYAGGWFSTAGGVTANKIAKWDGTTWSALGTGMNMNGIDALACDSAGNLYAGGWFTTAGGVAVQNIAKWNVSTLSWSSLGTGMTQVAGKLAIVQALAIDSAGNLYAGGGFTTAGGVSALYIAKWDGTTWSALGTGIKEGGVPGLAFDGAGNLYAGGWFTTAGSAPVSNIAKWDGTVWSAVGAGINNNVYALAVDSAGNIYAGGLFTGAQGLPANYIAKWNVESASWSALGTGLNGYVTALAIDSAGNLYAGGYFSTAGEVDASAIARWDQANSSWSALGAGMPVDSDLPVAAMAFDDSGHLYVGGDFIMTAAEVEMRGIAKWDGVTWSTVGTGVEWGEYPAVNALAFDSADNLYAGGNFTIVGDSLFRPYIAKFMKLFSSWF